MRACPAMDWCLARDSSRRRNSCFDTIASATAMRSRKMVIVMLSGFLCGDRMADA